MPTITTPTFHRGQLRGYLRSKRFNAWRCGRRFGKDIVQITIATHGAAAGRRIGLFAPEHKQLIEPYRSISEILDPIKRSSSKTEGNIITTSGGIVDFWSLNDNDLAGRGREYDDVLINEAAFTKKPGMLDIWSKSIKPTLLTRRGRAWVFSTPFGIDPEDFFWKACNDPEYGFKEYHAPTAANPYVPPDELERLRKTEHPLVFQQEYLAEFVDWSGVAFFASDKWMVDGKPLAYPERCDAVFAVIDTAIKTGSANDGTAVLYVATSQYYGVPVLLLDYDIIQIEGGLLETWLPTVYQRLEELVPLVGARQGHLGAFIEDKGSGTILLQQAARRGWPATPIDTKLTALGKDERAISVSGYHYQEKAKITQYCFDKLVAYKGQTRNHLITQVTGFRIGDKDAAKRSDDLTDTYTYALSLVCGNKQGY